MGWVETTAIPSKSGNTKPRLWMRYVDDVFIIVREGINQMEKLTNHLNQVGKTGSIKFTQEKDKDYDIPFLENLIFRKPDKNM